MPATSPAHPMTLFADRAAAGLLLTRLDREHRIAYILGVDSDEGGYIRDVPAATYRKRLSVPGGGSASTSVPTVD